MKGEQMPRGRCYYYYLCRKETGLLECRFCHRVFCSDHANATIPGTAMDNRTGHSCTPFARQAASQATSNKTDETRPQTIPATTSYEKTWPTHAETTFSRGYGLQQPKIPRLLTLFAAVAIIGFFAFTASTNFLGGITAAQNCEDGTKAGACSLQQPFLCINTTTTTTTTVAATTLVLVSKAQTCGCQKGGVAEGELCITPANCTDGTRHSTCSVSKPLYCHNGKLYNNSNACGCPPKTKGVNNACTPLQACPDSTEDGACSTTKPYYCRSGLLEKLASVCGCETSRERVGEDCVPRFQTEAEKRLYQYNLKGVVKSVEFTVYAGLKNYLVTLPQQFVCIKSQCPPKEIIDQELELRKIRQEDQDIQVSQLVNTIKEQANNDDQARIAVSLVQEIPYEEASGRDRLGSKYPYEVLYHKAGLCGEKSKLLALLLEKLGYGVALLSYPKNQHQAVGIKCPEKYSLGKTGYCFIETSRPTIITDDKGDYGVGELNEFPTVLEVSSGKSFDNVFEEYEDAKRFQDINSMARLTNNTLDPATYALWQSMATKYHLPQ